MLLSERPPTLIAKRTRPEAATSLHAAVAIVIISGEPSPGEVTDTGQVPSSPQRERVKVASAANVRSGPSASAAIIGIAHAVPRPRS